MSWAGLANNQAVSWSDLQDSINNSIFPWGGTQITGTNQCIYKNLATISNYVAANINGSRAVNDLLLKSDFSLPSGLTTIYGADPTNYYGYATAAAACAGGAVNRSFSMYYAGTLAANTRVSFNGLSNAPSLQDLSHNPAPYFYYTNGNIQLGQDANGFYAISTAACNVTITVTANTPTSTSITGTIKAWYTTNGGTTWTNFASYTNLTNTRVTVGSFTVSNGTIVGIAFTNNSNLNIQFGRNGVSFTEFCGETTFHNTGTQTSSNTIDYGVNSSGTTSVTC